MPALPDRHENFWYDTCVFLGTAIIAFGLGQRLETWLANDAHAAPLFYTAILAGVYWKWVLQPHTD